MYQHFFVASFSGQRGLDCILYEGYLSKRRNGGLPNCTEIHLAGCMMLQWAVVVFVLGLLDTPDGFVGSHAEGLASSSLLFFAVSFVLFTIVVIEMRIVLHVHVTYIGTRPRHIAGGVWLGVV
jgi:uncharacterized membrane protein YtjA (UPF0391 family)